MLAPPRRIPLLLRPALWLARRMTGKEPVVAGLLAHLPKAAVAGGLLELLSSHAPGDLDARTLKLARLAASVTAGCPFCIDMNAAEHVAAGLAREEVAAIVHGAELPPSLDERALSPRELIALTTAVAQVNYWARLNQALDVPAAGFFFEAGSACRVMPDAVRTRP